MKYAVSYYHNGTEDTEKMRWGCPVASKQFKSEQAALDWVSKNKQITPIKLLVWSDGIDCFETLLKF